MSVKSLCFFPYELKPRGRIGAVASSGLRRGALLRVQFEDHGVGYSDLFPWPELGDSSLEDELRELRMSLRDDPHIHHGTATRSRLSSRALQLALRDAKARRQKKNLLPIEPRVSHHFLISDLKSFTPADLGFAKHNGFTALKFKCGVDLEAELRFCMSILEEQDLRVRLDFNAKTTASEFSEFIRKIPPALRAKIEFVEDPCPYDESIWCELNKMVPLAMDHFFSEVSGVSSRSSKRAFEVLILKPARQNPEELYDFAVRHDLKLVVTSSLDHSVGIFHALSWAEELALRDPSRMLSAGCFSHLQYEADIFSSLIQTKGSGILPVPELGVGFDSVLAGLKWQEMSL